MRNLPECFFLSPDPYIDFKDSDQLRLVLAVDFTEVSIFDCRQN
jgi:hypothetical protein